MLLTSSLCLLQPNDSGAKCRPESSSFSFKSKIYWYLSPEWLYMSAKKCARNYYENYLILILNWLLIWLFPCGVKLWNLESNFSWVWKSKQIGGGGSFLRFGMVFYLRKIDGTTLSITIRYEICLRMKCSHNEPSIRKWQKDQVYL